MMFLPTAAQRAGLGQLLVAQRDPASSDYHHWLTPEQYADRFGLSRADLTRATKWLRSAGFTIEYMACARDWVTFSGTAAQFQAAFQTSLHRYTIRGETHFAVATEPVIPYDLKPLVATMFGLNDFHPKPMVKPSNASGSGHSLAPADLATIYDIKRLYQQSLTGTVIVGQAGGTASLLSDIQQFRNSYGLGQEQIEFFSHGTPPSTIQDDLVEADLDLEWAGAIAPNATLIYVYGADADDLAFIVIDQDLAPIVSESFATCEAKALASAPSQYEVEAKKGNALGITWIASSLESGAAGCDPGATLASNGLTVGFPASVSEITAVGGTEFNEGNTNSWSSANGGSSLGYLPEIAWNDTAINGSLAATGGGVSKLYYKPSWQLGPGVPADGQRDVPDIALAAANDHDPYNIITSGELAQVGGTSAAAPVFAGIVPLLNQYLHESGEGNINASLYGLAVTSSNMFHDVVNNSNIVPCEAGTANCLKRRVGVYRRDRI
jgi:subtilase family serine protease